MCSLGRPGPREPPKSAGNGGPGPPRYPRTVLGNHRISKSGWGTGWAPLGCPNQNAYSQRVFCFCFNERRTRPEILDVWGLGGLGGRKNNSKSRGAKPPFFLNGFRVSPGPPRPPKTSISGRPKNHILKTQVYAGPEYPSFRRDR